MARFLRQVLYAAATGLIGAALLHLVIVLALPQFSRRDTHTRVLAEGESHRFHRLGAVTGPTGLTKEDPFLEVAVCAYDLTEAPVQIAGPDIAVPFWSLAVFDSASNEVFSINDRTAPDGLANVIVATALQRATLRNAAPQGTASGAILAEAGDATGYAVLRALAPAPSHAAAARRFVEEASCAPIEWRVMTRF